jgi:hypothetical protein
LAGKMRVLCAWCCREGLSGYLGEREPLENPEPTHGVCQPHMTQLLESLPSQSYPDAKMVIVVQRGKAELYEYLKLRFATRPSVKVILDRRVSERRAGPSPEARAARRSKRRRIRQLEMSPLGDFAVVRFTPKEAPAPAPLPVH